MEIKSVKRCWGGTMALNRQTIKEKWKEKGEVNDRIMEFNLNTYIDRLEALKMNPG